MSYSVILGDTKPLVILIQDSTGTAYVLDEDTDEVVLRYLDPDDVTHESPMTITTASIGECTLDWADVDEDLPSVGTYFGQVEVTRTIDDVVTVLTFPYDGSKVIWNVYEKI
jgi:hypothetical protein